MLQAQWMAVGRIVGRNLQVGSLIMTTLILSNLTELYLGKNGTPLVFSTMVLTLYIMQSAEVSRGGLGFVPVYILNVHVSRTLFDFACQMHPVKKTTCEKGRRPNPGSL